LQKALAGSDQASMIRKRDVAGPAMSKLASIANDENPNRADIAAYIGKLTRTGQVNAEEAAQIMQALPNDPDGIRNWARGMFDFVMHMGIHAHAAFPAAQFPGQEPAPDQEEQPDVG